MITKLPSYKGVAQVILPKTDITIGTGNLGAKSASLRRYKTAIETTGDEDKPGLVYYPHVSHTPAFWMRFLQRIGASHERSDEAIEAIARSAFNQEELGAVLEALSKFPDLNIAVRSDECTPSGIGLWHSDFMLVNMKDVNSTARAVEIVKRILQSEFSRDVVAFKKRVGLPLEETPGVMFMPAAGYRFPVPGGFGFTSFYHANVITRFDDMDALVNLGVGMGGANHRGAITNLLLNLDAGRLDLENLRESLTFSRYLADGRLLRSGKTEAIDYIRTILSTFTMGIAQQAVGDLSEAILTFSENTRRQVYLELAFDGYRNWVALQGAPVDLGEVQKPVVPDKNLLIKLMPEDKQEREMVEQFGSRVSGRVVVEADYLVCYDRANISELGDVNKNAQKYVLVIDMPLRSFMEEVSFADYSNVAAIVCLDDDPIYNVATHLNGAFREAGIPVLVATHKQTTISGLEIGTLIPWKLMVYANDAAEEGFVAER